MLRLGDRSMSVGQQPGVVFSICPLYAPFIASYLLVFMYVISVCIQCIILLFGDFLVFTASMCNSNSHDNVYGAVIVAVHCHCESSPGSSDECSTQRQVAAESPIFGPSQSA